MSLRPFLFSALLLTSGTSFAQDEGIMGPFAGSVEMAGPTTICGYSFALQLGAGEKVRKQEGPDFILYYTTATDGPFLLYEGNFPQPHDDEIRTGHSFPGVIAIHDNRPAEAKAKSRVRDRLLTADAFSQACPKAKSSE